METSIVQPSACSFDICLGPLAGPTLAGPTTVTLSPNQSFGQEFAAGSAVQARAVVSVVSETQGACRDVQGSVEVFDAVSRRTRLLDLGKRAYPTDPNYPVDPHFPLAGLTSSDTLRMNVFYPVDPNVPSSACTVQATLEAPPASCIGLCSPAVLSQTTVTLNPGQSSSLVYSDASIATRRIVRPAIKTTGAASSCFNVITTVQILDTTAGRTFVLYPTDPHVPAP